VQINNVKKQVLIFFIILNSVYSAAGQSNYAAALDFRTGFLYGTAYELIYDVTKNSKYTSELQWNIKPLLYAGLSFEYGPKEPSVTMGLYGSVDFKIGLPMETGGMEDRDWLTPASTPGSLSLFSSHENKTYSAVIVDLEPGLSLPLGNNLSLKLYFGFSYAYFKFESTDGYTQYGDNNHSANKDYPYVPWNSNWPKVYISGLGIDYVQNWVILKPGIGFVYSNKYLAINASFSASPIVSCFSIDNHYMRSPHFQIRSNSSGVVYFEPKAGFLLRINDRFGLGLSFSYRYIGDTKGDIEQEEFFTPRTVKNTFYNAGGAAYKAIALEGIFRMSF
jgi:outer membrane protease